MSIVVNTNVESLMIQNNLRKTSKDMSKFMERLSTGLKINSASDDPAGMAISESLKSKISGSDIAKTNAQTGINLLNTMEGDLGEVHDLLQSMRDLAVQSSNSVYSTAERDAMDVEFQEYITEITRIADTSEFSSIKLLDGSNTTAGDVVFQIGPDNNASNRLDVSSLMADVDATALSVNASKVDTVADANSAITAIDTAIATISDRRSEVGANVNVLSSVIERLDIKKTNLQSSLSVIRDADVAAETANLTKTQILQQASVSLLQQANQAPALALGLL